MTKPRKALYTKGQLNKIVDGMVHPLARGDDRLMALVLDSVLHAIIEQDVKTSARKFMKYNAPLLIGELTKKRRKGSRSRRARGKNHRR
jgi:hypothetical protein